jgi:anti-sigma regulatory factor (Ser/Thr protein kinase)
MLVASELVNNAVLHSGCDETHYVQVRVTREARAVRICVRDPGITGTEAQVADSRGFGTRGLGLMIVDQLARRWGVERGEGYRVWAEVAADDPVVAG